MKVGECKNNNACITHLEYQYERVSYMRDQLCFYWIKNIIV